MKKLILFSPVILFVIFTLLKLTNVIDWSWWLVTLPIWLPIMIIIIIILLLFGFFAYYGKDLEEMDRMNDYY